MNNGRLEIGVPILGSGGPQIGHQAVDGQLVTPAQVVMQTPNGAQVITFGGLTKREYFAALMSASMVIQADPHDRAVIAVHCADALIAELAKKPEPQAT